MLRTGSGLPRSNDAAAATNRCPYGFGDEPGHIARAMTIAALPALLVVVVLWLSSVPAYDKVRRPIFEADPV
jgi:hypothetical protein